jgi:hypothetical protein
MILNRLSHELTLRNETLNQSIFPKNSSLPRWQFSTSEPTHRSNFCYSDLEFSAEISLLFDDFLILQTQLACFQVFLSQATAQNI